MYAKARLEQLKRSAIGVITLSLLFFPPQLLADTFNVQVHEVQSLPLTDSLVLAGAVRSLQQSRLSTATEGLVSALYVDAGSTVKRGDTLLELDSAVAEQDLKQATADRARAQTLYEEAARRYGEAERLFNNQHLPESELIAQGSQRDAAEAELRAAEAVEARARTLLSYHTLKAPFDGIVVQKQTELGEWVNRGSGILTLVSSDALRVDVHLPQERYAEIERLTEIVIVADTAPNTPLTGELATVVPVSQTQARTLLLRLKVEENSPALVPGTSAMATLKFASSAPMVVVPRDALLRHADGGYSVFVVEEGVATRRQIKINQEGAYGYAVTGVSPGDKVVVRGNEVLTEGQAVNVVRSAGQGA